MKRFKIIAYLASLTLLLGIQASAQGQGLVLPNKPTGLPGDQGATVTTVLGLYINIALAVVGIIAVGFLIYGGFRYITSAGNDEEAESAKKVIQNSIIGLIVIILSYVIVTVIFNALARGNI